MYNTVDAWAKIVIKEWLKKADSLGIHKGSLLNSFYSHVVTNSNGDPLRVLFVFEFYGNFVDWGVGKGVKIADKEFHKNIGSKRIPKPFLSDVLFKEVAVLRHLLAEKYANKIENFIIENIEISDINNSLKYLGNRI